MPILRTEWHPYTSEKLKRSVGACVDRCRKERFCSLKPQGRRRKKPGVGESPSLTVALSVPNSVRFCIAGLQQNAQGKGNAEGSKKEQDKAVASPPDTPARSADRVLRFLAVPEHFKSVLQNVP